MAQWTSRSEIESIWSALGVTLRLDDNDDAANTGNETNMLDDAIDEATETARALLMHRYADAEMDASPWVRRRVSYLAANILSIRRGNPAQFESKATAVIKELRAVRDGLDFVPDAVPLKDFGPSGTNISVDWRFNRSQLRADPQTATGGTSGNLDMEREIPYTEPY